MKKTSDLARLSPWRMPDELLPAAHPDRAVWTLRIVGGDCDGLLADVAWFDPEGVREHHWMRPGGLLDPDEESVEVVEMTVGAYLGRRWSGMNPFFTAGHREAMAKWRAHWGGR